MKIQSCAFNMDTACMELKFDDGRTHILIEFTEGVQTPKGCHF